MKLNIIITSHLQQLSRTNTKVIGAIFQKHLLNHEKTLIFQKNSVTFEKRNFRGKNLDIEHIF